jgi:2-C-methyl-D-erythritol 4-phosphate cytidylyltransferase
MSLGTRRVISWSILAFARVPEVGQLVLTVRPQDRELAEEIVDRELPDVAVSIVAGGDTRHASEYNALRHLEPAIESGEIDIVMIHDGARPLIGPSLIRRVVEAARAAGGAVPGLPVDDVVGVDADERIRDRFDDSTLLRVQTPQAFRADQLIAAYNAAEAKGFAGTDTASCVEWFGGCAIRHVAGDDRNIKLTYAQDLPVAEQILAASDDFLM